MSHPIDFFYANAGKVLRPYMCTEDAKPGDYCAVCNRASEQWLTPSEKVVFTSYGLKEDHCLACHSLYEGSINLFGVEREARGTPVPMKLGMATGCGALVTPRQTTLFLNGFIKKMRLAPRPPFPMVELSGKASHLRLIDNPPSDSEYLYIGNFGRKKKDLVGNLRLSNQRTLYICEESTCTEIDIAALKGLCEASVNLPKATVTATRKALQDIYTGRADPDNERVAKVLEKAASEAPAIISAVRALPADPHQTLNLLKMWES